MSTFTTSVPISKGDLIALDDDHFGGDFVQAGGNSGGYLIFCPSP